MSTHSNDNGVAENSIRYRRMPRGKKRRGSDYPLPGAQSPQNRQVEDLLTGSLADTIAAPADRSDDITNPRTNGGQEQ